MCIRDRHDIAREQPDRLLGVGLADHAEVDLQRRRFEASHLGIVGGDRLADIVRRPDPGRAFLDLRLERLLGDDLDRFLVVGIILGRDAGHPFRRGLDDGPQVDVQGLACDRSRLLPAFGAEHVKREHHAAAARMARRHPGVAVHLDELGHLRAAERDPHQMVPQTPRVLERVSRRQRSDPERRARRLRRTRQRRHLLEAVESPPRGHVLLREQKPDLLKALVEPCAALIHRQAEASEFVRQKCPREADLQSAFGDRIDHSDLARELQRIVEDRQHGARDQPHGVRDRRRRRQEDQRIRAIAAIRVKIVLHRPRVAEAELLSPPRERKRLIPVLGRRLEVWPHRGKELNSEFHVTFPSRSQHVPRVSDSFAAILRDTSQLRCEVPQDEVILCGLRPRERSCPPTDLMVRSPSAARASRTMATKRFAYLSNSRCGPSGLQRILHVRKRLELGVPELPVQLLDFTDIDIVDDVTGLGVD